MFDYIRNTYNDIKERYHLYSYNSNRNYKPNKILAFFKAILSYVFGRPKPVILSGEERNRFESGLDRRLTSEYDIEYKPNSITFKRKSLVGRL